MKDKLSEVPKNLPGDRWTYLGGALALGIAFGVNVLGGEFYGGAEARQMIGALSSSALYFGAAIATSASTILALMLNLVGMSREADESFSDDLYESVLRVGALSTITLCGAMLLLLLLSLPVGEFDDLPLRWYPTFYWILVSLVSGLTGMIIAVVLMLFNTIRRVVRTISPL